MKVIFFLLTMFAYHFLFAGQIKIAQDENADWKSSLSTSFGKAYFTDTGSMQRNPSFSIGYRKQYFKSFAFEAVYQYAQNNNFPDFFNNPARLSDAILAGDMFSSNWDEGYLHSLGLKSHFVISGGGKWFLSAYLTGGVYTMWSSNHFLTEAVFIGNKMIDYESEHVKKRNNGLFYKPGLEANYRFFRNYFMGFNLSIFRFIDLQNRDLITAYDFPVLPEYYNASFVIGILF